MSTANPKAPPRVREVCNRLRNLSYSEMLQVATALSRALPTDLNDMYPADLANSLLAASVALDPET